jgi:hypothetical protein
LYRSAILNFSIKINEFLEILVIKLVSKSQKIFTKIDQNALKILAIGLNVIDTSVACTENIMDFVI